MSPYDMKCGRCDQIIFEHNKRAIWGNEIICASCYDEARYVEASEYKPVEMEHKGGFVSGDTKAEFHRDFILPHEQAKQLTNKQDRLILLFVDGVINYDYFKELLNKLQSKEEPDEDGR